MGQLWFIVNFLFVISFIFLLFSQRTLLDAKLNAVDHGLLAKLKRRRNVMMVLTIILFIAMSVSFMAHMKING